VFSHIIQKASGAYFGEAKRGGYGLDEARIGLSLVAERLNVVARWIFKTFFLEGAAHKIVAEELKMRHVSLAHFGIVRGKK
jgi:hypothetical protein